MLRFSYRKVNDLTNIFVRRCILLNGNDFKIIGKLKNRSVWTFRSDYEKKPVEEPEKIRASYSNFYFKDLHLAKTTSLYYVTFLFGGFILVMFGKPLQWIKELETFFGAKDHLQKEKNLSEVLKEEPESVKRYFAEAKSESRTTKNDSGENQYYGSSKYFIKANSDTDAIIEDDSNEDDTSKSGNKKIRTGFRDSRIISYEDRVRSYSTPDKIFRYFATIQDVSGEIYMTPQDFVRSITPGVKQPEGLGLDSFLRVDIKKELPNNDVSEDSVFYLFGENALINFSDFVFLLTVICTPQRQFEIAFRMFDLNGDGELDVEEFNVVRTIIKSGSSMGKRHRDNIVTGNTLNNHINSALSIYFFGKDGNKKLTIDEFIKFQLALQKEIMSLEFNRYNPVNGFITEIDFADALLMYAGFTEHKKRKFLRRIRQRFNGENSKGITIDDYFAFSHFLRCISDVDTALTFYHLAGAAIDQNTLKHVCKAVANVDLSNHIIDLVFALFDENNDGQLSNREFVMVMKQRLLRGLDKPMDTGFIRLLSAMSKCAKNVVLND